MTAPQDKKPLNVRVKSTIEHLQRLIDHERTSDEERDAARRALERIAKAYAVSSPREGCMGPGLLYNPGAWAGEKYWDTKKLTLTEIAKLIRADLKLARKVGRKTAPRTGDVAILDPIGDAPREVTFSVRTAHYSAIRVVIKNIPEGWGWNWEEDRGQQRRTATPAMIALYREVEKIHQAYNYNNSDITTDYFESRYGGSVSTEPHIYISRY